MQNFVYCILTATFFSLLHFPPKASKALLKDDPVLKCNLPSLPFYSFIFKSVFPFSPPSLLYFHNESGTKLYSLYIPSSSWLVRQLLSTKHQSASAEKGSGFFGEWLLLERICCSFHYDSVLYTEMAEMQPMGLARFMHCELSTGFLVPQLTAQSYLPSSSKRHHCQMDIPKHTELCPDLPQNKWVCGTPLQLPSEKGWSRTSLNHPSDKRSNRKSPGWISSPLRRTNMTH